MIKMHGYNGYQKMSKVGNTPATGLWMSMVVLGCNWSLCRQIVDPKSTNETVAISRSRYEAPTDSQHLAYHGIPNVPKLKAVFCFL